MESKATQSSSDIIYTNIHISFERGEAREEQTAGENGSSCSSARDGNEEEKKKKTEGKQMFCRGAATMEPHSRTRLMIDQVTEPSPVAPPPPAARIFPFANNRHTATGVARARHFTHTQIPSL